MPSVHATDEPVSIASSHGPMQLLLVDEVRRFLERSDDLVRRQHREILTGTPTPQQMEHHRGELKWGLWLARLFHRLTSHKDFSDRTLAETLHARLWQLEESWKLIYEEPSEEEAAKLDKMIQEVFPDESRA